MLRAPFHTQLTILAALMVAAPIVEAAPGQPVPAPPPSGTGTTGSAVGSPTTTTSGAKKLKRKKPVQPTIEEAGSVGADAADAAASTATEPDTGFRGFYHPKQKGKDGPYRAEVGLNLSLLPMKSTTPKQNGQKGETVATQGLSGDCMYLMIFGPVAVGPSLGYSREMKSQKQSSVPTDATQPVVTKDVTITTTNARYGLLANLYMARIDKDRLVPFGSIGFSWATGKESGGAATVNTTGTVMSIGAGLYYFLDSNIALSPGIEYQIISSKQKDANYQEDSTSLGIAMGISTFI